MTPLKKLLTEYTNLHSAGKAIGVHPQQLKRWIDNDAHINHKGEVYIKTKGSVKP